VPVVRMSLVRRCFARRRVRGMLRRLRSQMLFVIVMPVIVVGVAHRKRPEMRMTDASNIRALRFAHIH
jgi:hypothetical protein